MEPAVYINLYIYQAQGMPYARLTLNQSHGDGSSEGVVHCMAIERVEDFTDLEDYARQVMAQAIELT